MFPFVLVLALFTRPLLGDITGQQPQDGACLCVTQDPLNIRDQACSENVIGTGSTGQCYKYVGQNQYCDLGGNNYHFFAFEYSGQTGWAAGNFLRIGADSECDGDGGINDYYECAIQHEGMRIHETTAVTPFDCVDSGCANTCLGGQCVAYVTCNCVRPGTSNHPPGTSCWRPGAKLVNAEGKCDSSIPINSAIATFSGSSYTYHTGVFMGCVDDYTIRLWDQWCCRQVGVTDYTSAHSYYNTYYVITSDCGDRGDWPCRVETPGGTCCETYQPGCLASATWYPGVQS